MSIRRASLPLVLAAASCSLLPLVLAQNPPIGATDEGMKASLRKFSQVYDAVEANFADKIDADRAVYQGAIPGMLHTLDPHSAFYDPKAWASMREQQSGHYFGVGMLIGAPRGKVVVMYPFQGSPAFRAGIRPGDEIVQVNEHPITKPDTAAVSSLLKGPRGTPATITVHRLGQDQPLTFTVIRDNVPRGTVNYSFWLRPGIAYMKIEQFNETTSKEVDRALSKFPENAIEGLVLDLRGNPGGLVQEAVNVADRFLQKGQGIVSHHGRSSAETKFAARKGARGPQYPIVVLVNRNTASAAEILSGALQDHDRAWIIGENTFGKGLVQAPFPVSGNGALMLTIAKYYTPSGRLIQRDYAHTSMYEYYNRGEGHNNEKDMRKTDSGRVVFGGDGISPDQRYFEPKPDDLQRQLIGRLALFDYAPEYFSKHPVQMSRTWTPDEQTMEDFRAFAAAHQVKFTTQEWEAERSWIADRLREQLFVTAFSKEESDQVAIENDPEIRKAVESLPASKTLLEKAHDVVARQSGMPTPGVR